MAHANAQLVQFLQQEKIRLEHEIKIIQQNGQHLAHYVDFLVELYWQAQEIKTEENALDMLDELLKKGIDVVGASDGSISQLDSQTGELVFVIVHGAVRDQLTGFRFKAEAGVAGWVLEAGESIIIDNAQQDWRFSMEIDETFSFLTNSILCVPIMGSSKPIGVIQLLNKSQQAPFTQTDETVITVLSDIAGQVLGPQ